MTRTELERLRVLLQKTADVLRAVRAGEVDRAALDEAIGAIDGALALTDPHAPRPTTPLGQRILDAAREVGLDARRMEEALHDAIPMGSLTRLLHHEVKKVRPDVLGRVADVIGCELSWLQTGTGERRTKPIPQGVSLARVLGASEEAIRIVLERDASVTDRDEKDWTMAFLSESKTLEASRAGPHGTPKA